MATPALNRISNELDTIAKELEIKPEVKSAAQRLASDINRLAEEVEKGDEDEDTKE